MNSFVLYLFYLVLSVPQILSSEFKAMKIIDEPSNQYLNPTILKSKISPSSFSGPLFMHQFKDKCFDLEKDQYVYKVCMFNNITQTETENKCLSFSGILGIWKDWEINNDTFTSLVFSDGDKCGEVHREAKVKLECGPKDKIVSVEEPKRCYYELVFESSLFCSQFALAVYNAFNETFQAKWFDLKQDFVDGFLTQKGYDYHLYNLYLDAGFVISQNVTNQETVSKSILSSLAYNSDVKFDSLKTCTEEYIKLQEHIKEELLNNTS